MSAFAIEQSTQPRELNQADLQLLNSLEDRFWSNKQQTLATEKRIEELELFVFGEIKTGTLKERITVLRKATGETQTTMNSQAETKPDPKLLNRTGQSSIENATVMTYKKNDLETNKADDLLEESMRLFGKGELSEAEALLETVLVLNKHDADAYYNLGAIAEAKADLDSAIRYYQSALKERPDDKEVQEALSSVNQRKMQLKEKSNIFPGQSKSIDYALAQGRDPQGKVYSSSLPTLTDMTSVGLAGGTVVGGLAYIYWHNYRGGGIIGRWISKTYPDFTRSSYDHQVAILNMENSNGWTSNNPLGIKADAAAMGNLSGGSYKVAISAIGDVSGLSDTDGEPAEEFVRNGGYLVVTGNDLAVLPHLMPDVIDCYSLQTPNRISSALCVDAEVTKAAAPLSKGLSDSSRWCIPARCPMLQILDPKRASALVVSQYLKEQYPQGSGVLAALISYGKGGILCLAGNITPINGMHICDVDSKMHIPLREGLFANFLVSGLRNSPIHIGANHS
jgi:tetratricopeptide (TPR) repeat protein